MPSAADSIQFSRHGPGPVALARSPWPDAAHFFLLPQMKEQIMPNPKPGVRGKPWKGSTQGGGLGTGVMC